MASGRLLYIYIYIYRSRHEAQVTFQPTLERHFYIVLYKYSPTPIQGFPPPPNVGVVRSTLGHACSDGIEGTVTL